MVGVDETGTAAGLGTGVTGVTRGSRGQIFLVRRRISVGEVEALGLFNPPDQGGPE